jgi:hypothetical protein
MFSRMCETGPAGLQLAREEVAMVGLEFDLRQQLLPARTREIVDPGAWQQAALDRCAIGIVALEVVRVDLDPADRPGGAEADDRPVVPRPAAPPRFPPVAHVRRAPRHQQVVLRAVVHVADGEHDPAVPDGGEVDHATRGCHHRPVHRHLAVGTQPGDATVRIDVQPQVGPGPAVVHGDEVVRVATQGGLRQDGCPGWAVSAQRL